MARKRKELGLSFERHLQLVQVYNRGVNMPPSPFAHGLALAWSDGALSREGALMLERLQGLLGLSDKERAQQEERWLSEISKMIGDLLVMEIKFFESG